MIQALNEAIINTKNEYSSNRSYLLRTEIENLVTCGLYFYYKNNNLTEGIIFFQNNFSDKNDVEDNLKKSLRLNPKI